jgi:quercetin dioxygenase-like cupin family protein
MLKRTALVFIVLAGLLAVAVGTTLGTGASGVSAETARGPLVDRPLEANMKFADGSRIRLDSKGPIEVVTQRIVAIPGATFGWHSHSGPTVVTIFSGTMSFYHAEHCTAEINYGPGTSFSNLPSEIHLARNEGTVDLVVFATYYQPVGAPIRIDQPSPGAECPQ